MEDINNSGNNNQFNFNSISELNKIYSSNGNDKQAWENLLLSTYQSSSYNEIMSYLVQTIRNQPSNTLTLDIIDFMVDFGPKNLIKEISRVEFMNIFFNLLKRSSGSGPAVQKNGIYLTKKWKERADNNPNEKYDGFINNYFVLSKNGISFPPSGYKIDTYEKYISEFEANITKSKAEGNQTNFYNGTSFNNNNNYMGNNINNNNMNRNANNNNFQEGQSTPFGEENEFNLNDDIPSNEMPNLDNFFSKMQNGQNDNNNNINNINNFDNMNRINNNEGDEKNNNISENKFISGGKMNNVNIINNINNMNNLNDMEEENNGFPKIEDEDENTNTQHLKKDFNPFILPNEIEDDEDDKNKNENNINKNEDVKKEENNNNIIKEDNKIIENNNNKHESKMMYPDYNESKNNTAEKMDDFGQFSSTPTGDNYLDANQIENNVPLRSKNDNFNNNINNFETPLSNKNSTWNNNNIIEDRNNQYENNNNNNFSEIIINNNFKNNNFNNNNFNNINNNNFNNSNFNGNNFNNDNNNYNNNNFNNNNFNNNYNFNNNNNYNNSRNSYDNNYNDNNNNFNNYSNNNTSYYESDDPYLYKKTWMIRIELYNKWISDGELCYERKKLKDGIKSILDESKKIEYLLNKYSKDGNKEALEIILNIKSDMFQTCSRYEKFINNKSTEKFVSSFDGNKKKYSFKREKLFLDNNINANASVNNNHANNINENHHKGENKYIHGIKKFGGIMKSGIFNAGKVIKKNSLKGYNYVKEKINKDEDKMNNNSEEIWSNYMNNLEYNDKINYQNNQNKNNNYNNNNNNNYNNYKSMINNNNYNNNYMNQNSSYQMNGQYSNYNINNNNRNSFNNFNNNSNNNMNNYNNNNQNNFSNINNRNSYNNNNYNNKKYF